MKKIGLFLLIGAVIGFVGILGAGQKSIITDVVNAFKKKDASALSSYFNDNVEIDIPGNKGVYSSGQAKVIMQQYFDNHNPSGVTLSHSGSSSSGSKFAILDYSTSSGSKKAKIYFTSSAGAEKIQEIKIE